MADRNTHGFNAQRQRTQNDPLYLGAFTQTSIRYLKGSLGPANKLVGYKDTNQSSNGGFGGGTYNHWFRIELKVPAWLITAKGPPRPKYINLSAYDLDLNPIQGRGIFDADSVPEVIGGKLYHPYVGHVMGAQSDIYNEYDPLRVDKGDDRYFPLAVGNYLLCVSSTRNEPLDYAVAIVIEIADLSPIMLLEDYSYITLEDNGTTLFDTGVNYNGNDTHEHSLQAWQGAWTREHQETDPFPDVLLPYITSP
jgi:hypothetical protein